MSNDQSCHEFEMDLAALSAGELTASPELEAHLAQCADCHALLEALQDQRDLLLGLEDPPGFELALLDVRQRVMGQRVASGTRKRSKNLWLIAAACIPPLLAFGWFVAADHHKTSSAGPVEQARITPPAPVTSGAIEGRSAARRVTAVSRRPKLRQATPYDPVRAVRRILEPASDEASRTVLIQQSPQVVIYWVKPTQGGVS